MPASCVAARVALGAGLLLSLALSAVEGEMRNLEPAAWPEDSEGLKIATHLPRHTRCDACRTMVEEFGKAWVDLTRKHSKHSATTTEPPSFAYDDDVHEFVLGHCNSKAYSAFAPWVREVCLEILPKAHRPKFVAPFLGSPLSETSLRPTIARAQQEVCTVAYGICPRTPSVSESPKKTRRCDQCKAIAKDLAFVVRRLPRSASSLDVSTAAASVCGDIGMRHPRDDVEELVLRCEKIFDSNEDRIFQARSFLMAEKNDEREVVDALCSRLTRHCKQHHQEL